MRRTVTASLILLIGLVLAWARAGAHDVPNQITVQAFLATESEQTELLARIPLVLLQGRDLPTRGPGFIDFEEAEDELRGAAVALARQLQLLADGEPVVPERYAHRVSLPSERVFETVESARAHVLAPDLPASTEVMWNRGFLDVYFVYPGLPDEAEPAVHVALGSGYGGLLELVLRHVPEEGEQRIYRVHGDYGRLVLDPGFWSAAATFTRSGIEHILSGIDHLLFVICLILPFRLFEVRNLILTVTAFTIAHSITLIAAALGYVPVGDWFPPLIEVVIAASIVFMAIENLWVVWAGGRVRLLRFRWLIAGAFGLIHGFGFAFVLSDELQFAGDHLISALLAFNVGVELGQIAILFIALPALELVRRTEAARQFVTILGSLIIGHTAWHWMLERIDALALVDMPQIELSIVRPLAAGVLILLGTLLLLTVRRRSRAAAGSGDD